MTHIIYSTQQSSSRSTAALTPEKCLAFYKRHLRNTLLLERLKSSRSDFDWTSQCELEIRIGQRKCDYWYRRGEFSAADLARATASARLEVNKMKLL